MQMRGGCCCLLYQDSRRTVAFSGLTMFVRLFVCRGYSLRALYNIAYIILSQQIEWHCTVFKVGRNISYDILTGCEILDIIYHS